VTSKGKTFERTLNLKGGKWLQATISTHLTKKINCGVVKKQATGKANWWCGGEQWIKTT